MKRFKNILCVIEPDEPSKHALEKAVSLAVNNQAGLTVVSVIEPITAGLGLPDGSSISKGIQAAMIEEYEQRLELLLAPYRDRVRLKSKLLKGTPFLRVIHEVLQDGYDLVIKAPEHQDWHANLFGSDDMHLLRKCPCPVWLAKPFTDKTYRKILAAVDIGEGYPGSEVNKRHALSLKILEMAASLALSEFAELHVVHAWEAIGESVMRGAILQTPESQINDYVAKVKAQHAEAVDKLMTGLESSIDKETIDYLKPHKHIIRGSPRKEIPLLAKELDADLVVMGTVGRTGVPGLIMGNTAETILNQLSCSVLAVKPQGFISPAL